MQPTEVGQGAHDGDRRDPLRVVRYRNKARSGFVFKLPSPEVANIEAGIGLPADAIFAVLVRIAVMYGDRTLSLWFG